MNEAIARWGRTVTIYRDAQNITEKRTIMRGFYSQQNLRTPIVEEMSFFLWNSEIRSGDVFQDVISQDRSLVVSVVPLGTDAIKDGLRVGALRCNDSIVLYELIPTGVVDDFGKRNYNPTVRVNDFAFIFQALQADQLAPIGEIARGQIMIVFSARKLAGYVPKMGDRCVLLNGQKYQVDDVDPHMYPGNFKVLASPDQRTE